MKITSVNRRLFLSFVPASLLAFPLTEQASAEDNEALVEKAKAEGGPVAIYSAGSVPIYDEIAAAFEQKYGIRVDFLTARSSEIVERIRTEQSTGNTIADLVYTGHNDFASMQIEPYGDLPNAGKIAADYAPDGRLLPIHVSSWGVLVSTKTVEEGGEPKSWLDLLEPRFKGKILMDDPRARGGGEVFFRLTYETLGRDFHEKLWQQAPTFTRDYVVAPQRVARGEFSVFIPMNVGNYLRLSGLPVKLSMMQEGSPYVMNYLALLKGGHHPNAARLLMNFFLEDESQLRYAPTGRRPVITGLEDRISADVLPLLKPKLLDQKSTPDKFDGFLDIAAEIYK